MGTLYLVRHGQASFGAADYDRLSALGTRQCERLGAWFASHGIAFDAVYTGTLRRHAQSWAAVAAGLGAAPPVHAVAGLDEYDPQAVIRLVHPAPLAASDAPDARRHHFRLLRQGLAAWMAGAAPSHGLVPHRDFVRGVVDALDRIRTQHADATTLVVSSGGPIAHAVGHVLGLGPAAVIDLNLHLRNSALCELRVDPRRHTLISFNTLPHLGGPEHRDWITYA